MDLSTGTPDPALLPDLAAALRRVRVPTEPSSYLDDPVIPQLVEILHANWPFAAERITVVDGAMDALQLVAATHLGFGDRVAVEQPCFPPLLDLIDATGAVPIPVDIDDDGPLPDRLASAIDRGARALFLQPRAQNPTGASVSPERAEQLTAALHGSDVLVVEDDSVGAVSSTDINSLGTTLPHQVVHVRSYSKSHGPDLRLAALGGPAALIDPIVDRRFLGQGWTSRLLQQVLVDLLTNPAARAAVDRARTEYSRRRSEIVRGLAGAGIAVGGRDGLNIWLPVADESAGLLMLATRGIGASAGAPFHIDRHCPPHLRVTTGLIADDAASVAAALTESARVAHRAAPR